MWKVRMMVIPIVIGAFGEVSKGLRGCPHGVMVKTQDCGIVVSSNFSHAITFALGQILLGKGMNLLILPWDK